MMNLLTLPSRSRAYFVPVAMLAVSGLVGAQEPPQPPQNNGSNGGWRRVTDPPPAPPRYQDSYPDRRSTDPNYPPRSSDPYPDQQRTTPPLEGTPNDGPAYQQNSGRNYDQNYSVPPQLTIRPGTFITVRVNQALSSDHNQPGDAFAATLVRPIVVDGVVVAQRGQMVGGRVAEAVKAGRVEGVSRLGLQLTDLTLVDGQQVPIQSQLISRSGGTSVGRDVAAVGATTALGAAIGGAADWGRGAAIGAGAGAVAGLIGVFSTRGHATVLYPETVLTFRIEAPVTVITERAPQAFRYVDPNDYERPYDTQQRMQARPPVAGGACGPYGCPPPAYYGYGYGYGYPYGYGYGYPYYWGPGVSFYFGRGFYGPRYYGGFRGGYHRR
jgi:hypothetical protein